MQLDEMIKRLRARDEEALDWLMRHYRPLICYIITPILDNGHDREECISEVVMRVWDGIDSFDSARGSWKQCSSTFFPAALRAVFITAESTRNACRRLSISVKTRNISAVSCLNWDFAHFLPTGLSFPDKAAFPTAP